MTLAITQQLTIAQVRTAYFHQYSDGSRKLKIEHRADWHQMIDITTDDCISTAKWRYPWLSDIINHCMALGFQSGTYAIDNRTQLDYHKDWLKHLDVCAIYGIPTCSYQEWRDRQVLAF